VNSWVFEWAEESEWTLWMGWPPSEMKEELSKVQPSKKDGGGTPGLTGALSGNHLGQEALRREQCEQLESNHLKNRATGKEGDANHSPWKGRNGGTPVGYLSGSNVACRPTATQ
jgi:hypothetical protein